MIEVERTFAVSKGPDVVVEYLKDFSHAEQWDPGTKSCVQETPGPVGVGTTWHNVSEIKGRETELTYRLEELEPGRLRFVGTNDSATSTDTITVTPADAGASIHYHARIEFHGLAKVAGWFLQSEFEELGDKTARQITAAIDAL